MSSSFVRARLDPVTRLAIGLDLVSRLHDEHAQPDANVGGDHVHQTQAGDELASIHIHLKQV